MKPESVYLLPKGVSCFALMSEVVERALGEKALRSALPLFAYMWRRFGPPWLGCDGYKELANWFLYTCMDSVWLNVSCKANKLDLCFGVATTERWEVPCKRAERALVDVIRDLERPVYVRDVPMNIYGRISVDDETGEDAGASRYAGYGMMSAKDRLDAWIAEEE